MIDKTPSCTNRLSYFDIIWLLFELKDEKQSLWLIQSSAKVCSFPSDLIQEIVKGLLATHDYHCHPSPLPRTSFDRLIHHAGGSLHVVTHSMPSHLLGCERLCNNTW